jgi:hypothetical protein
LLLAEAELGAERLILGAKFGLTQQRQLMHALPVGGLAVGLELLGEARADGAGAFGQRRRGASGRGGDGRQDDLHPPDAGLY